MRWLNWEMDAMMRVYHQSRIFATVHSEWFFSIIRRTFPTVWDSSIYRFYKLVYTYEHISKSRAVLTVSVFYPPVSPALYLKSNGTVRIVALTHLRVRQVYFSLHPPAAILVIICTYTLFLKIPIPYLF